MLDRFTARAQRVFTLARREAERLGDDTIETTHMLLAMAKDAKGVAYRILKALTKDVKRVVDEVTGLRPEKPSTTILGAMPFSQRLKRALEAGADVAAGLGLELIGTDHILQAMAEDHLCQASEALRNLGVSPLDVRSSVKKFTEKEMGVVEKKEPEALKTLPTGPEMGPEAESEFQTDIKIQINTLLWAVLPASATMKEAEAAAVAFWDQIVKLREKYKCTGAGS